MTCDEARPKIQAILDDPAGEARVTGIAVAEAVDRHIAGCKECRRLAERLVEDQDPLEWVRDHLTFLWLYDRPRSLVQLEHQINFLLSRCDDENDFVRRVQEKIEGLIADGGVTVRDGQSIDGSLVEYAQLWRQTRPAVKVARQDPNRN